MLPAKLLWFSKRAQLRQVQKDIAALQDQERQIIDQLHNLARIVEAAQNNNFAALTDDQKAEIRRSVSEADTKILGRLIGEIANHHGISPSQAWSLIPRRK